MSTAPSATPIIISPKVNALERYKHFLRVTSLFLEEPLTDTEINILDEFYAISKGEITTESRKKVYSNLNMSTQQLNNYIGILRKKKIILKDWINPRLLPDIPDTDNCAIVINMIIK